VKLTTALEQAYKICESCGGKSHGRFCSNRCKMRGPEVECSQCGGPAWERPRNPGLPVCKSCSQRARRLKWTRERMLAARDRWHKQYGWWPSVSEWRPSHGTPLQAERYREGEWPHHTQVVGEFGSWEDFLSASRDEQEGLGD
jgi:hypothetical protein